MNFTFRPKYSFFVLSSNILGIKLIKNIIDLFPLLLASQPMLRFQCFVWRFVSILSRRTCTDVIENITIHNRSFYQISCATIIVIFLGRYVAISVHVLNVWKLDVCYVQFKKKERKQHRKSENVAAKYLYK